VVVLRAKVKGLNFKDLKANVKGLKVIMVL